MVTSTNITRDFFQTYFWKNASSKQLVKLQRITIVVIGTLAFLLVSQFETILEMALISYTMIGASLAPAFIIPFFWKRVTRQAGVASIAASMVTVLLISIINRILDSMGSTAQFLGIPFPIEADYIAIPALFISVSTLVIVSLLTPKPPEEVWKPFME
jgi:SSS family solute:Na+ symporter/sodium/proline symporter